MPENFSSDLQGVVRLIMTQSHLVFVAGLSALSGRQSKPLVTCPRPNFNLTPSSYSVITSNSSCHLQQLLSLSFQPSELKGKWRMDGSMPTWTHSGLRSQAFWLFGIKSLILTYVKCSGILWVVMVLQYVHKFLIIALLKKWSLILLPSSVG